MSTIATLTSTETGANSLTDINNNFSNLNTDKVEGQSSSVDSEIALFSGTGGKTIKRASASGIAKVTSGVLSAVTAPSGAIVGDTDTQTLTNKTLTTPTIGSFTNATHNHQAASGGGTLAEAALALTDITTNNVSATAHGFAPKFPNNTTTFLRGDGTYAAPVTSFSASNGTLTLTASGTTTKTVGFQVKQVRIFAVASVSGRSSFAPAYSSGGYDVTSNTNSCVKIKADLNGTVFTSAADTSHAYEISDGNNPGTHNGVVNNITSTSFDIVNTLTGSSSNALLFWEAIG